MGEPFVFMIEEYMFDSALEILEEESSPKSSKTGGLKFKAIFQEAEEVNNNRRIYRKAALTDAIARIDGRIKSSTFFGELDHPKTDSPARFASVMLSNASHVITALEWNNNTLQGVGKTLSTRVGRDMRALIEEDGIKVGFSLRALGATKQRPDGIVEVTNSVN